MGSMCHTPHDQGNNFGTSYYDSNCLNHATLHLWQNWFTRSNSRYSLKYILNCSCHLNIEHCDHNSVEPKQS
jgi:hypothetical protein